MPSNPRQKEIPFARVNHNKYMVTDKIAYIGEVSHTHTDTHTHFDPSFKTPKERWLLWLPRYVELVG